MTTQRWNKDRDEWGDIYTTARHGYALRAYPVRHGYGGYYVGAIDTGLMIRTYFHLETGDQFADINAAQAWCVETADRMAAERAA
jgi:hypothetical protein